MIDLNHVVVIEKARPKYTKIKQELEELKMLRMLINQQIEIREAELDGSR